MSLYRLSIATTTSSSTIEGEATPSTALDGNLRLEWGCDDQGRGVSVSIKPLQADAQMILHSMAVTVIPSAAGPDDA